MSERKIPIYLECGYSIAMQVLGGKWKICIIEALRDKPLRPSLIFKEVPDATERVINHPSYRISLFNVKASQTSDGICNSVVMYYQDFLIQNTYSCKIYLLKQR